MSAGRSSATGGRRRRRTPEVAEEEIVAAAEALLRERPFRELTVDEVMRRTDLSRPSFYVYFRDRHHLMLRVVEHLGGELRTMSPRWYTGAGDGPAQAREAMEGIVEVYERARAGAARRWPTRRPTTPRSSASTAGSCSRSSTSPRSHIEAEIDGRAACCRSTPQETARALVWMMERYLNRRSGREPDGRAAQIVVDTLTTIWTRVLYGER